MTEWLLHHYAASPYAEKARLMLGHKQLAWGSIEVPMVPPRPVLQQLLGGFRRIPVLQRGADLFCDTRLLPDVLDHFHTERPLLPPHARALSTLIAQWAEPRVFVMMGPVRFESRDDLQALQRAGIHPGDFLRDRAPFMAPAVDTQRSARVRDSARDHVSSYLGVLQSLLGDRPFLCGDAPTAADFSACHTVWWLRVPPGRAELLARFPALGAWADRMAAIGHGDARPRANDDALQAVRAAQGRAAWTPPWPAADDARLQRTVRVVPDDYGRDPVTGVLSAVSDRHVTVTREVPDVGKVHVHFPKVNYEVVPLDAA
ncbi:MAG TPA: glutathione S-transferase family protein [Burkholderiaceae bacterium]